MKQPTMLEQVFSLQRRMRGAETEAERGFIAVNETRIAFAYHQAALWLPGEASPVAINGVAAPERDAPYIQWLKKLHGALPAEGPFTRLKAAELPAALREGWGEWLHGEVVWLPFPHGGGMLFSRDAPGWSDAELAALSGLTESYGEVIAPARIARRRRAFRLGRWAVFLALLAGGAAALAFIRTPLSVLAPAEIVAANSRSVRAPVDGVVAEIFVRTNQQVSAGERLFALDPEVLETDIAVTGGNLRRSFAEYQQESQRALDTPEARLKLASLAANINEQRARLTFLEARLEKLIVRAREAGRVVMSDANEWIGRPVATGEAVMSVAHPGVTVIEGWMSAADAIPLEPGSHVRLFLNAAPLSPLDARLDYMAYQAEARPDGAFAHRLRAVFDEGTTPPRPGLQGTLRADGPEVSLGYWLFRRPLAMLRSMAGI